MISPVVLGEIEDTPDEVLRARLHAVAAQLHVLRDDQDIESLAREYINQGIFSAGSITDARHVAAAVLAGVPVLASWNFKHLVNRSRRIRVNLVNATKGLGQIEIVSPPEIE